MPTYTFAANTTNQLVNWSDPSVWSGGIVPNAGNADVLIPAITETATGNPYIYFISIQGDQSYQASSLNLIDDYLVLNGTLSVTNGFISSGELDMQGGSLSVGSLQNNGFDIQGSGRISSSATIVNQGLIIGSGLTLSFAGFQNSGELSASSGLTVETSDPGGFENLIGSTLSGGTWSATGGSLDLNVGGSIVTDAAIINLGSLAGDVMASFDGDTGTYLPLQSTLQTIAPSGVLSLGGGGFVTGNTLTVEGTLTLTNGATLSTAELGVASGGQVSASGTIVGLIENAGTVIASLNPSTADIFTGISFSDRSSGDLVLRSSVTGTGSLVIAGAVVASTRYPVVESGTPAPILTYAVATLELAGPVSENVSFVNDLGSLVLDAPNSFSGTIVPSGLGDDVVLPGVSLSSITSYQYVGDSNSGVLQLRQAGGEIDLNFAGDYTTASFLLTAGAQAFSSSPPSVVITEGAVACFAAGTNIATPGGNVRVDDLKVGGLVATGSGKVLPIMWIGRRRVVCRGHPAPRTVQPVKIIRNAFAPGQPARELLLSPDHAVFVDGVLIPIKHLINDVSIIQIAADEVVYYHVELSSHDLLLAEGLPTESYLDTGDRSSFGNFDGCVRLFPEFGARSGGAMAIWDAAGYARLVVTGPVCSAVRQRLALRARLLRSKRAGPSGRARLTNRVVPARA